MNGPGKKSEKKLILPVTFWRLETLTTGDKTVFLEILMRLRSRPAII